MDVRRSWADYFDQHGVQYAFFSAANAAASQNATKHTETTQPDSSSGEEDEHGDSLSPNAASQNSEPDLSSNSDSDDVAYVSAEDDSSDAQDPKTKVLSVIELEALFEKIAPDRFGRSKLHTLFRSGLTLVLRIL
jgi:large subunit GTPase 1